MGKMGSKDQHMIPYLAKDIRYEMLYTSPIDHTKYRSKLQFCHID